MACAVTALVDDIADFAQKPDLGHVATACALAYLDLRAAPHLDWRASAPQLADWFAAFELRPSMQSTRPE
jgi:glutathione S-transferase